MECVRAWLEVEVNFQKDAAIASLRGFRQRTLSNKRTKEIIAFAETVQYSALFEFPEYEQFTDVFGSMFKDLAPDFDRTLVEELFPSNIPGVALVRTMITIAEVEDEG
jgi:hypothetical protein